MCFVHVIDPRRPFAVIIGIAEYALPRLRLASPVRDAEALATCLEQHHGYEVRLVRDREASKAGLQHLLEAELPRVLDDTRPLLIYFAGHGMATDSIDRPRGYLVPVDGGKDLDSLLPMGYVARALGKLPSRHLMLLLDCCFAGAFRWSAGRDVVLPIPPTMYRERYERFLATPAWQVIASAAHDEQAADVVAGLPIGKRDLRGGTHSPFLQALLRGLSGSADVSPRHESGKVGDGVITATELYLYLREEIEAGSLHDRPQTPGMWTLPRHRKGEYIFHVPAATLTLPDAPTLSLETSPYRGFLVYEEKHAELFHGRRAVTEVLRQQVERQPITVVVGSSGTGKSSLVRAGLVPALRKAYPHWQILPPIRPGAMPLATLDAALAKRTGAAAVLVVDQLEELFAAPERSKERNPFLARLLEITTPGDLRVVGTLRADLETELWSSPLGKTWENVRFPLGDMTQSELREAIEAPADQKVLTFEPPEMVDRLINTVVSMPGGLPLLSFTLHKLYVDCLRRANNDRKLIELDETGAGGIALALREHTDRIYASFDAATRDTMRRVLLRMVTVKGGTISRRQLPLTELEFADHQECERVQTVLDALTGRSGEIAEPAASDPGATGYGVRLAVRGGSLDGGFIELAHDAVVRDWPQFRSWLRDASEGDLLLQRAVTASATLWVRENRHAGYLWRGDPRLALALSRLAETPHQLNESEADFVVSSRAAEAQEQEAALERTRLQLNKAKLEAEAARHGARSRRLMIAALSIALVAVGIFLYFNWSRNQMAQADAWEQHGATALADRNFGEAEMAYAQSLLLRQNSDVRHALLRARGGALSVSQGFVSAAPRFSTISGDGALYAMVRGDHIELGSAASRERYWSIPIDLHASIESLAFGNGDPSSAAGRLFAYAMDLGAGSAGANIHRVIVVRLTRSQGRAQSSVATLGPIQRATKRISSMAFDRSDAMLAIGSDDGSLGAYALSGHDPPCEYWFNPNAHTIAVHGVAFRADGAVLASGGGDYEIHLWWMKDDRKRNDRRIAVLAGHQDSVFGVAFSLDGTRLASGGYDRAIRIWDVGPCADDACVDRKEPPKLETIRILQGHSGVVESLQFSSNGAMLASVSKDQQLRLWDVDRARSVATLEPRIGPLRSVAFSDFGAPISCGGDRGWVRWDSGARRETHKLWIDGAPITALAIDPTSAILVAGNGAGMLWAWQLSDWSRAPVPLVHVDKTINGVAFSPDRMWLAVVGEDQRAHVWRRDPRAPPWDPGAWTPVEMAMEFPGSVWGIAFDDRSKWFAAGCSKTEDHPAEIRVWDTSNWKQRPPLQVGHDIYALAIVSNVLVSGNSHGELHAYTLPDLTEGKAQHNVISGEQNVWGLAADRGHGWVVSANSDGIVRVWSPVSGLTVAATGDEEAVVNPTLNTVAYSAQRGMIAASGDGQQVVEYKIAGSKLEPSNRYYGQEGTVWMVTYSPDGRWLAYGGLDGFIRVIDLPAAEAILK
ncbi:MAG: hypothetical protein E6J91_47405, partial [Deltaproteobacteria bacterium]